MYFTDPIRGVLVGMGADVRSLQCAVYVGFGLSWAFYDRPCIKR